MEEVNLLLQFDEKLKNFLKFLMGVFGDPENPRAAQKYKEESVNVLNRFEAIINDEANFLRFKIFFVPFVTEKLNFLKQDIRKYSETDETFKYHTPLCWSENEFKLPRSTCECTLDFESFKFEDLVINCSYVGPFEELVSLFSMAFAAIFRSEAILKNPLVWFKSHFSPQETRKLFMYIDLLRFLLE